MTDSTWYALRALGRTPLVKAERKRFMATLIRRARTEGATWAETAFAARRHVTTIQRYANNY